MREEFQALVCVERCWNREHDKCWFTSYLGMKCHPACCCKRRKRLVSFSMISFFFHVGNELFQQSWDDADFTRACQHMPEMTLPFNLPQDNWRAEGRFFFLGQVLLQIPGNWFLVELTSESQIQTCSPWVWDTSLVIFA